VLGELALGVWLDGDMDADVGVDMRELGDESS
jgi:hypothetical protein